jgi:hypothetical protein
MKITIIRRAIITATNSRLSNSLFLNLNLNNVHDNVSVKICDDCDGSCVKKTYK